MYLSNFDVGSVLARKFDMWMARYMIRCEEHGLHYKCNCRGDEHHSKIIVTTICDTTDLFFTNRLHMNFIAFDLLRII